jgi:hypothetical protein
VPGLTPGARHQVLTPRPLGSVERGHFLCRELASLRWVRAERYDLRAGACAVRHELRGTNRWPLFIPLAPPTRVAAPQTAFVCPSEACIRVVTAGNRCASAESRSFLRTARHAGRVRGKTTVAAGRGRTARPFVRRVRAAGASAMAAATASGARSKPVVPAGARAQLSEVTARGRVWPQPPPPGVSIVTTSPARR